MLKTYIMNILSEILHMDKIFCDIFSKQPDEIINGDYFYHNPAHEEAVAAASIKVLKKLFEEIREERAYNWLESIFKSHWEQRTFQDESADWIQLWKVTGEIYLP